MLSCRRGSALVALSKNTKRVAVIHYVHNAECNGHDAKGTKQGSDCPIEEECQTPVATLRYQQEKIQRELSLTLAHIQASSTTEIKL